MIPILFELALRGLVEVGIGLLLFLFLNVCFQTVFEIYFEGAPRKFEQARNLLFLCFFLNSFIQFPLFIIRFS